MIIFMCIDVDPEDMNAVRSIRKRFEESGKKVDLPVLNILSLTCLQVYFSEWAQQAFGYVV